MSPALLLALVLLAASCDGFGSVGPSTSPSSSVGARFPRVKIGVGEPIVLGTLLATSGDNADLGKDSLRGVELAIDYLDGKFDGVAGSLLGHPIRLLERDDRCSAEGGRSGATQLAADPTVVAVIGTSCTSSALGVADGILSDRGVLLVSPSNTTPSLTEAGTHQSFYLRVAYNGEVEAAMSADFAHDDLEMRTAAILHDRGAYATEQAAAFARRFEDAGGVVTSTQTIPDDGSGLSDALTHIELQSPDLLYAPNLDPTCGRVAARRLDGGASPPVVLLGASGCFTSTSIEDGGVAGHGSYVAGPDLAELRHDDFYSSLFLPAYEDQFGTEPTAAFHAYAFDAANLVLDAIDTSAIQADDGSLTLDRTKLRDAAFGTEGYLGLTGTLSCTPLGDCATSSSLAVYRAPSIPIRGGEPDADPVFSTSASLDSVER